MKETLGFEAEDDDWLESTMLAASPLHNFFVFATANGVIFARRPAGATEEVQELVSRVSAMDAYIPDESLGDITCVSCIPMFNDREVPFHIGVIGFSGGNVEFVLESGEVLLSHEFLQKPVKKIRELTSRPIKVSNISSLVIGHLSELLLVYDQTVVSVEGQSLVNHLMQTMSKSSASKQATLVINKWQIKDQQSANDVAAFSRPNYKFDELQRLSMTKFGMADNHLSSLSLLTSYVTTGEEPFLQSNSPHSVGPKNINELATNVISTVKTGLFKAATDWWGGGNSGKDEAAAEDQGPKHHVSEHSADVQFCLKDQHKEAEIVELCPDKKYMAACDSVHNRVVLVEAATGSVIHIWKGYHHAQVAWTPTLWEGWKERSEEVPGQLEQAVLLVIYLPRRGLLEVWSPEQKRRITEFNVDKKGRLVATVNGFAALKRSRVDKLRKHFCVFVDSKGKMSEIFVPIHSVTDSVSSYDLTTRNQIKHSLKEKRESVASLKGLVFKIKTTSGKIGALADIAHHCDDNQSLAEYEDLLVLAKDHVQQNQLAIRQYEWLVSALKIAKHSAKEHGGEKEGGWRDREAVMEAFKISMLEAEDLSIWIEKCSDNKIISDKPMLANVMSTFVFPKDDDAEESKALMVAKSKPIDPASVQAFLVALADSCKASLEDTIKTMTEAQVSGKALLATLLTSLSSKDLFAMTPSSIVSLFHLCVNLYTQVDGLESTRGLFEFAKNLLCKTSLSSQTYVVTYAWRSFLQNHLEGVVVSDLYRIDKLTQSYLNVREAIAEAVFVEDDSLTFEETFNAGNGRIADIVAKWLSASTITVKDLDEASFAKVLRTEFPTSLSSSVLGAHLCWMQFKNWHQARADLDILEQAIGSLKCVGLDLPTKNRLGNLVWTELLNKMGREAINLTEIRSGTRCERELGFEERELPRFLELLCDFLYYLMAKLPNSITGSDLKPKAMKYDMVCPDHASRRYLLDILTVTDDYDQDALALRYQFVAASSLIWQFGLDVKPLKLFNNTEVSFFFQTANFSLSSLTILAGSQSMRVQGHRRLFLEAACNGAVTTIAHLPTKEVDSASYNHWNKLISALAALWNFVNEIREMTVVSLYNAGYDDLGEEQLASLTDQPHVLKRLLNLAALRLARHLEMCSNRRELLAFLPKSLEDQITAYKRSDLNEVRDVPLKSTLNLLDFLASAVPDEGPLHQQTHDLISAAQILKSKSK